MEFYYKNNIRHFCIWHFLSIFIVTNILLTLIYPFQQIKSVYWMENGKKLDTSDIALLLIYLKSFSTMTSIALHWTALCKKKVSQAQPIARLLPKKIYSYIFLMPFKSDILALFKNLHEWQCIPTIKTPHTYLHISI